MRDRASHRITLEVFHDDRMHGAVDVQLDDGVEPGRPGKRGSQETTLDGDGERADAVSVHDAGNPP